MKFFLKQELIWVPIIGTACWSFDFPFMKRYSKSYLKKHPEKLGTDLEATRKACMIYKRKPVSIINFKEPVLRRRKSADSLPPIAIF